MGSRSNTMGADVGERSSHEKEHCRSKASWLRKFFDLPRIQHCYREKALVVIPPVMRICATSNGEQRVQVLIPVMQGLSQKQRHLVQQYFELVDWQGLQLPSAERRQRDSLKKFERSVEVCKDWIRLNKEFATLGEELPPAELLPAKRREQHPDPTKRDASREEFGRRALAGGNMWESLPCLLTLLESLTKKSRDGDRQCGKADASKDGAALLGQHSQATGHGGRVSHTQRHVNSTNGGGFESNHVSDSGTGTVRQSDWRAYNETKRRG